MPAKAPTKRKSKAQKTAAQSAPAAAAKGSWNLMVYIAGESALSASMISQLKELTDAGFQRDTRVLVYFDPNCNGKAARIYDVNFRRKKACKKKTKTVIGDGPDPFVRDIAEDCQIQGLPQMPAAITLRYFLDYARVYYPAENYLLFLMGHGVIVGNDAFLPDPDDNSAISMVDLGWILKRFGAKVRQRGGEFHLVGFHSCSMSSVELAYELAGSAHYMMGTQGATFPGSWPYRQILKKVFSVIEKNNHPKAKHPNAGPDKIMPEILSGLQNLSFYNSEDFWLAGYSADLSLCSLDQVGILTEPLKNLIATLKAGVTKGNDEAAKSCIQLAHLESQSYWNEAYTDLYDFCSCLAKRCTGKSPYQVAIKKACRKVTEALKGKSAKRSAKLVLRSDYFGPGYQYSNGLSIYFPWRSPGLPVLEAYGNYHVNRQDSEHSWKSFLTTYFVETRRELRGWRRGLVQKAKPGQSARQLVQADLRSLSDGDLLAIGTRPANRVGDLAPDDGNKVGGELAVDPNKVGGELAGDPNKVGGELAVDPNKVGGELAVDPNKVGGELAVDPNKVGGELAVDPNKVGGELAVDPNKVGGELGVDPNSVSGGELAVDPNKVGGELAVDPNKVGGEMGLAFGKTTIKNFPDPSDKFVTSRRQRFSPPAEPQEPARAVAPSKRVKRPKARK